MKIFLMPLFVLALNLFSLSSMSQALYSVDHILLMNAKGTLEGNRQQITASLQDLGWSDQDIKTFFSLSKTERVSFVNQHKSGSPQEGLYRPRDVEEDSNPN